MPQPLLGRRHCIGCDHFRTDASRTVMLGMPRIPAPAPFTDLPHRRHHDQRNNDDEWPDGRERPA